MLFRSVSGPPRKLASLKHARLCRSAAQPPDPEISALQGCGTRSVGGLWGFGLSYSRKAKLTNPVTIYMSLEQAIEDIRVGIRAGRYTNEASVSQGIVMRILHSLGWPAYDTGLHPLS